jgi:hypothetical protein
MSCPSRLVLVRFDPIWVSHESMLQRDSHHAPAQTGDLNNPFATAYQRYLAAFDTSRGCPIRTELELTSTRKDAAEMAE